MTLPILLARVSFLKAEEDIAALVKKISPSVVSIFAYDEMVLVKKL
jgi:hypothetical protein